MNITFLIGNGFDVGVGMKSKFKDFFPVYKVLSLNKEERIKQLSDEIENDYENWSDFERALGVYTKKFDKSSKQDFLDQLKDFQTEFIKYLRNQVDCISFGDESNIRRIMESGVFEFYKNDNFFPSSTEALQNKFTNSLSEGNIYNFINFNYTPVLEKCLGFLPKKSETKIPGHNTTRKDTIGEVVYVHGYMGTFPIIGVNDTSQIINEELASDSGFTRRIVKPLQNKYLRYKNDANATRLIEKSSIICIYGMSLGDTDAIWWDRIVSWLNASNYRHLVIFDYDENFSTDVPLDWFDKEDSIIQKLSNYNTKQNIDVNNLRTRIHIAVHKNIFAMKLMDSYNRTMDKVVNEFLATV